MMVTKKRRKKKKKKGRHSILPGMFVVVLFYMGRLRIGLGLSLRIVYIVLCFLVEENTIEAKFSLGK